jgi:ATP-dependent protease ClpP protease subunit
MKGSVMNTRTILLATCMLAASFVSAQAATITTHDGADGYKIVNIDGDIEMDGRDLDAFKNATQNISGNKVIVTLDSVGGHAVAGFKIGDIVHDRGYSTAAVETCQSSCADIWIAGATRYIHEGTNIGFHRPYTEEKGSKGKTIYKSNPKADAVTAQYFHNVGWNNSAGIKWSLTGIPGPQHMNWLTPELAKKYGIAVEFVKAPKVATFSSAMLGSWCAASDFAESSVLNRVNKPEDCKTVPATFGGPITFTFATNDLGKGTMTDPKGLCTLSEINELWPTRYNTHDLCENGEHDWAFRIIDNRLKVVDYDDHEPTNAKPTTVAQRVNTDELPDDDREPARTSNPRHGQERTSKPHHGQEHVVAEPRHHETRHQIIPQSLRLANTGSLCAFSPGALSPGIRGRWCRRGGR